MEYLAGHGHGYMFYGAAAFNQAIGLMGYLAGHEHEACSLAPPRSTKLSAHGIPPGHDMIIDVQWRHRLASEVHKLWLRQLPLACSEFTSYASSTGADRWSSRRVGSQRQRVRRRRASVNGAAGTCTDTLASGSSCTPTCDSGYTVSGASSCLDRVLTSATCAANPCDASGAIANGNLNDCTSSLASGASCTPTCDSGYTLSGTRSCSAGTLTDTVVCTANSPQATPSSPANSSVSSIPPPPSPSSPQPPQLIKDDDDAAHVTNNLLGTLILACMTLLL